MFKLAYCQCTTGSARQSPGPCGRAVQTGGRVMALHHKAAARRPASPLLAVRVYFDSRFALIYYKPEYKL